MGKSRTAFVDAGRAGRHPDTIDGAFPASMFDPLHRRIFQSLDHVDRAARDPAVTRRIRGYGALRS